MTRLSRDPRRQPAAGAVPAVVRDALAARSDQRALVGFGERALALGVGVAVADELVAARHEGRDQFGAMVIERGVDQRGRGQAERSNSSRQRQAPTRLPYSRQP